MKITRIELCHPVNRPGKHDDNYRELPPPSPGIGENWALELGTNLRHVGDCVTAWVSGIAMVIPMHNIKCINFNNMETKKK
jgi:hypothetical protein